jgi:hypothetical protein
MNRRFFMKALAASLSIFGLGKLVNAEEPKLFRYSKFFRRCDEATMNEFRDTVVLDEKGHVHKVPIIWATDDRAAEFVQAGDSIKLPLMNLYRGDLFFAEDKIYVYYHLNMHSFYEEDMNQMVEQAVVKFHPLLKHKVGEYSLMSIINNYYPGGSHMSVQVAERGDRAMRGDIMSAAIHGKQGEWVKFKKGDEVNGTPRLVLKWQLNMMLKIEGKP